jgi:hypothetical protein
MARGAKGRDQNGVGARPSEVFVPELTNQTLRPISRPLRLGKSNALRARVPRFFKETSTNFMTCW